MASGPVPSWARATSTSATTIWPGATESSPACAAMSFSASVAGMAVAAAGVAAAQPPAAALGSRRMAASPSLPM